MERGQRSQKLWVGGKGVGERGLGIDEGARRKGGGEGMGVKEADEAI